MCQYSCYFLDTKKRVFTVELQLQKYAQIRNCVSMKSKWYGQHCIQIQMQIHIFYK